MIRRPPRSTLFPCTPLFRSSAVVRAAEPATLDVPLRFNEIAAADAADFFVEVVNRGGAPLDLGGYLIDRKSTRLNSSHANISYAVFCLKNTPKHMTVAIRLT